MNGEVEFDADLERRISEDQAAERERSAAKRRYRFAEVETLAKRLVGGVEHLTNPITGDLYSATIDPARAFDLAEEFMAERDRRKAEEARS